jgi:hypothetical protein
MIWMCFYGPVYLSLGGAVTQRVEIGLESMWFMDEVRICSIDLLYFYKNIGAATTFIFMLTHTFLRTSAIQL